jgi:hypothetical protein
MPSPARPRAPRAAAIAVALLAAGALAACASPRASSGAHAEAEAAIRRGEFGRGHDAIRRATDADSGSAMAWWRRSVAAELAHRGEDADRAIAEAERRAAGAGAGLSARDRRLIRAQARWRAGDALAADSLLRDLVREDARDADAWFGVAEVAYHAGPLYGRPLDLAREPWRRVVHLDPASYAPVMHLVRLEARAGDTAAVGALLRASRAIGASGAAAAESPVVAAYATGRDADTARATAALDAMPHFSVAFLRDVVAGMLERPDLALGVARRLVTPERPPAVRANGHVGLRGLRAANGAPPVAERGPAAATAAAHLAASLDPATVPAALAGCGVGDAAADVLALCDVLHAGRRVALAPRGAEALVDLERAMRALPFQLAARSPYLAASRERWLVAALHERLGNDAAAERWYAAVPHGSLADHVYLAASHLRRGAIRERAGDRAAAAAHYRRVAELMPTPDAELAALRGEADAGLRRTAAR